MRIELHETKTKASPRTAAATAEGITVARIRGSIICKLCRKLIAAGHNPDELAYIYRRETGTLCFEPVPLRTWAALDISEPDNGETIRFVKHRPSPFKDGRGAVRLGQTSDNAASGLIGISSA